MKIAIKKKIKTTKLENTLQSITPKQAEKSRRAKKGEIQSLISHLMPIQKSITSFWNKGNNPASYHSTSVLCVGTIVSL